MKGFSVMAKNLPDFPYSSLDDLARDWKCSVEKIIHYGIAGQLKICTLSAGWELQEGYYADDDPDGFPVPVKERWSNMGELLVLTPSALRQILSCGEVINPEFIFEEGEGQSRGDEQYERFLSSVIFSQDMTSTQRKIAVKKTDLVIRKEGVELFLAGNKNQGDWKPQTYDLSTMKTEDRDKLVLNYAVHVWEEYRKENNGNPPRIVYVHDKIEKNECFKRTKTKANGEPTPSYQTITKNITYKLLDEIQSRKNAQKCG